MTVNGARRTPDVDHRTSLLDLLRERLGPRRVADLVNISSVAGRIARNGSGRRC